jgi:hypothetical protein
MPTSGSRHPKTGNPAPFQISPATTSQRRLAKDFENLAETLGAFVALASIQLALRRLARA